MATALPTQVPRLPGGAGRRPICTSTCAATTTSSWLRTRPTVFQAHRHAGAAPRICQHPAGGQRRHIQGTALADYEATISPIPCAAAVHVQGHGRSGFDAGTLGNHEFNYGLPFLNQVLGGGLDVDGVTPPRNARAQVAPAVLANVYSSKTKKPLVQPLHAAGAHGGGQGHRWQGSEAAHQDRRDRLHHPGIMNWDKRYPKAKVHRRRGRVGRKYVPSCAPRAPTWWRCCTAADSAAYSPTTGKPRPAPVEGGGHRCDGDGPPARRVPDTAATPASTCPAWMPGGHRQRCARRDGQLRGKALGVVQLALQWDGCQMGGEQGCQQERAAQHPEQRMPRARTCT